MESKEDPHRAEVRRQQRTWAPQLELEGAAISWGTSIRDFQRWHLTYVVEALKQPLLLPRDMEAIGRMKQPDLFLSLKKDLAMVIIQHISKFKC